MWDASEAGALIVMCAWCRRLLFDGQWVAPPVGALSTIDESLSLSHSICDGCARRAVDTDTRPHERI